MPKRLLLFGLLIWAAATVLLRLQGQVILAPDRPFTITIAFALSFPLMAWVVRALCRRVELTRSEWPLGAVSIALPTLLIDPFSSAFFPVVFPNIAPQMAGVFGGWMLWCCAGAFIGATMGRAR